MPSAHLSRITIYPIKSLDGIDVQVANVLPNGALANDRRFALVDAAVQYVNGKRTAAIHRIRATYDLSQMTVALHDTARNVVAEFSLVRDHAELSLWLTEAVGITCVFVENVSGGFPDDNEAPGPTVVSTATLAEVCRWFPGLTLDETRRRFRANMEIDGVEPFWEDRLFGPSGTALPFGIGESHWLGTNPCQRCVVPSRATESGEITPAFQGVFAENRRRQLPSWSPRDRFNHFYRLAVNTRPAPGQTSAVVRVGDLVQFEPRSSIA